MKLVPSRPRSAIGLSLILIVGFFAGSVYSQEAAPVPPPGPAGGVGVGDLLVAPVRIILEGRDRTAEIVLVNTGSKPATYRISFMEMTMLPTGQLKEVEGTDLDHPASPLIRFSPRQVVLEPHKSQTVRLQLRKPAGLQSGEYRSHLLFRAVPETDPAADDASGETKGFQVKLIPVYGLSIPVIVRDGELTVKAALSNAAVVPSAEGAPVLRVSVNRSGSKSVYGNMKVTFQPAGGGPAKVVGLMNGMAVYPPLDSRTAEVTLTAPPGVTLTHGRLHLSFTNAEQNGDGEVLAETDLELP